MSDVVETFAYFLEVEYDIDGATEAGVIIESLEQGAETLESLEEGAETPKRPCGDDVQTNLKMRPDGPMMTAEAV